MSLSPVDRRIQNEGLIFLNHEGLRAFAHDLPLPQNRLRTILALSTPRTVRWNALSDLAAETLMGAVEGWGDSPADFCRRNHYPIQSVFMTLARRFPERWKTLTAARKATSTPYRRGRRLEYTIRDALKRKGYLVTRTPKSGSAYDLIAIPDRKNSQRSSLLVQCKRDGYLPPAEWNALWQLTLEYDADAILASNPHRGKIVYEILCGPKKSRERHPPKAVFTP